MVKLRLPFARPARAARSAAAPNPEVLPMGRTRRDPNRPWLYEHTEPPERRVSVLEGKHPGARMLVVGTGPSAKRILPHDERLHGTWDVVVGLNGSVMHLQHLDYFLSVESKAHLWPWYAYQTPPRVTRCVSESGARVAREDGFVDDQPALFLLRHVYDAPPEVRHYRNQHGEEGLLVGGRGETGLGRGTVTLQALHFAAMLGARSVHLIGSDLHFPEGAPQHFYGGNEYGTHEVEGRRYHAFDVKNRLNPIVETTHPRTGRSVETTLHFRESATFIDEAIRDLFAPAGVEVFDFSDGLISTARTADLEETLAVGAAA